LHVGSVSSRPTSLAGTRPHAGRQAYRPQRHHPPISSTLLSESVPCATQPSLECWGNKLDASSPSLFTSLTCQLVLGEIEQRNVGEGGQLLRDGTCATMAPSIL
ncbi:unnamed protein product, partial [Ectocarpus sp. 8 AP-2014]